MKNPILPLLSFTLTLCTASCTRNAPAPAAFFHPDDQPFLLMAPPDVTRLEVAKNDSKSGDRWTAAVKKIAAAGAGGDADWELENHDAGFGLLDRAAHGGYIAHLLDTLQTLKIVRIHSGASTEALGLNPPFFVLRWDDQELEIGAAPADQPEFRFARFPKKDASTIYVVQGAAIKILGLLGSFADLRQQTVLAPLASDDIDEIQLFRKKQPFFYAQREGDVWTDRKHRPIKSSKPDVSAFLDRLTHLRAQSFIDDAAQARQISQKLKTSPLFEALLIERNGRATRLSVQWMMLEGKEGLFGANSARTAAPFRLYPEVADYFEIK